MRLRALGRAFSIRCGIFAAVAREASRLGHGLVLDNSYRHRAILRGLVADVTATSDVQARDADGADL